MSAGTMSLYQALENVDEDVDVGRGAHQFPGAVIIKWGPILNGGTHPIPEKECFFMEFFFVSYVFF